MNRIVEEDLQMIVSADLPWEDLRNKTIFITGGGGFLASYLVRSLLLANRLQELNMRIISTSRGNPSDQHRLVDCFDMPELSCIQHDISQPLPADMPHVDMIIHSASQASPKYY
jgi:nucleoside-diphosphate-sugar epimerase